MRPDVAEFTELLYLRFNQHILRHDEENNWAWLRFLESFAKDVEPIRALVRDDEYGPGWSKVLDVDRVPSEGINHLAQFVGVRLLRGMTDQQKRDEIKATVHFKRGRLDAVIGAVQLKLTGTKRVKLIERFTTAYNFKLITYTAETPDPAAVLAVIKAAVPGTPTAKPAGLIGIYDIRQGQTWGELRDGNGGRTWAETLSEFDNWQDARDLIP